MENRPNAPVASSIEGIEFETQGPARRAIKTLLVNPLANYLPAGMLRLLLHVTRSELAAANWSDPGGWRSMVISYHDKPTQVADKVLVGAGTMAMALRNRLKLSSRVLANLIDSCSHDDVHVLCLGAGPGHIITDAMCLAQQHSHATLVDLSSDAFDYGRQLAEKKGLAHRVRFVQSDVAHVGQFLDRKPDIVKMLGICEYIGDDVLVGILKALAGEMSAGSPVIFNSLSKLHGTDRFFRRVFGLAMIHRSPERLEELFAAAGFEDFRRYAEPLNVYHVIVGRRSGGPSGGPKG